MSEDRPIEEVPDAIGALRREFEDFKTTTAARLLRRPTGDVEIALRDNPKPGTLFMVGQVVNRADYPELWTWVQEQSLLRVGLFGPGNGSTTFGLPNMAGRVPIGVGTLAPDTYVLGTLAGVARLVIAAANLPVHDHGVHGNHGHNDSGFTNTVGGHGGHVTNWVTNPGYAVTGDPSWTRVTGWGSAGGHNHTVDTGYPASAGGHASFGSSNPTGLDVRQPSIAVNWAIWT